MDFIAFFKLIIHNILEHRVIHLNITYLLADDIQLDQ